MKDIGADAVPAWLNVSRETLQDLQDYCGLIEKWNPRINLISKTNLGDLWTRHILDCCQLYTVLRGDLGNAQKWCDFGSGGGLPGLIVAILAKKDRPNWHVTLVESDRRKAVFLSQVIRQLGLNADVISDRIEELPSLAADILSARALAPLDRLCGYAELHLRMGGTAVFPKGASADDEVQMAQQHWQFALEKRVSQTDPSAAILLLKDIRRV